MLPCRSETVIPALAGTLHGIACNTTPNAHRASALPAIARIPRRESSVRDRRGTSSTAIAANTAINQEMPNAPTSGAKPASGALTQPAGVCE